MRGITLAIATLGIAVLALPAGAWGQGNSAADQYIENPPGVTGEGDPGSGSPGGGNSGGDPSGTGGESAGTPAEASPVPQSTIDELNASGSDGRAAASLAQQTSPGGGAPDLSGKTRVIEGPPPLSGDRPSVRGDSAQTLSSANDGGIGLTVWLILAAAALVTAATIVLGRRRFSGSGEPGHA